MNKKEINKIKVILFKNMKRLSGFINSLKYDRSSDRLTLFKLVMNGELPGRDYIDRGAIVKNIEYLGSTKFIPFTEKNIIKELEWLELIIKNYSNEINKFIEYKLIYEKALISGEYDEANKILELINGISLSNWALGQQFVINEFQKGIEHNKKVLSEISEKISNIVVALLMDCMSFKAEKNTSYESLRYKLEKIFAHTKKTFADDLIKKYLFFKIDIVDNRLDTLEEVLALESTMSILDIYETFVRVCQVLMVNNTDEDIRICILSIARNIKKNINDKRLEKILLFSDQFECEILYEEYRVFNEVIEKYTVGRYEECLQIINNNNLVNDINFDVWIIYVKSHIYTDRNMTNIKNNNISSEILILMYELYIRKNVSKNIKVLKKLTCVLSDTLLKYKLISFIQYFEKHNNDSIKKLGYLNSLFISPKSLEIYELKKEVLKANFKEQGLYSNTISTVLENRYNRDIDLLRLKYYKAKQLIIKSQEDAIEIYIDLINNLKDYSDEIYTYYYARICKKLYGLYIAMKRYDEAINLIVDAFFVNSDLVSNIELSGFNEIMIKGDNYELYYNINTAILVYIINNKDYQTINQMLANYLQHKNVNILSELLEDNIFMSTYSKQMEFILEKLYIEEVIKRFVFIGKNDVSNERIKALKYLLANYPYKKLLDNELNSIIKEQSIKEKIKHIDDNKIFVDSKSIFNDLKEIYEEKFQRYLFFKNIDINIFYVRINDKVRDVENLNEKSSSEKQQSYLIFKEMFEGYLSEILFNPNYGLSKFLSSRIRHGTLQDYLFKPFKRNNLLSKKKDSDAKGYYINDFIEVNRLDMDSKTYDTLKLYISDFTEKVIKKIEEVKLWININDSDDPKGMFDYNKLYNEKNMEIIFEDIKDVVSYETFYNRIVEIFWDVTEESLAVIRKKIESELCSYFRACLDELSLKLQQLKVNKYKLIDNLISEVEICKSLIRQDLEVIQGWFNVKRQNEYEDFEFNDVIMTCIQINNKLDYRYKEINIKKDINVNCVFKGDKFSYWIDIVNNMYTNAIKYSGFIDMNNVEIMIKSEIVEDYNLIGENNKTNIKLRDTNPKTKRNFLRFEMKNKLSDNINKEKILAKIHEVGENLSDPNKYKQLINKEGGTGLYKIANIMNFNLGTVNACSFDLEDNMFTIEIFIELTNNIIVEE
ncbi:hypothetical protein [Clostridium intestinale]|uniref:hypothetical protein n=1 Tax=Clostridium intestinale TaxID=36845 RepID=UPI0028EC9E88|nr:hypothetical protein [Clostridium intestinale]